MAHRDLDTDDEDSEQDIEKEKSRVAAVMKLRVLLIPDASCSMVPRSRIYLKISAGMLHISVFSSSSV